VNIIIFKNSYIIQKAEIAFILSQVNNSGSLLSTNEEIDEVVFFLFEG
jgi:hypothetical protein